MASLQLFYAASLRSAKVAMGCIAVTAILFLSWIQDGMAVELTVESNDGMQKNAPLSRDQLREIFFARQTRWDDGKPVRAFVLPDQHPLHIRFSKEILEVYPYQLRAAWDRMIYSGTGVPPTVVESVEEMRNKIKQTSGSVGYFEE